MNASFTEPIILTHVKMIEHLAKRIGNAHLNTIGLTQSQADIIVFFARESDKKIHQRDIERALNYSNPTITGLLNRLEQKGLITRTVDVNDLRMRLISLTNAALSILEEIYRSIQETEKKLLAGFSKQEVELLAPLMARIAKNALRSM